MRQKNSADMAGMKKPRTARGHPGLNLRAKAYSFCDNIVTMPNSPKPLKRLLVTVE